MLYGTGKFLMDNKAKITQILEKFFTSVSGPYVVQFCVGDFGIPITESNYGHFKMFISEYEIDKISGRLNLKHDGVWISILLSELYLTEEFEDAILFEYNYAWAVISEDFEQCPTWMFSIEKAIF